MTRTNDKNRLYIEAMKKMASNTKPVVDKKFEEEITELMLGKGSFKKIEAITKMRG